MSKKLVTRWNWVPLISVGPFKFGEPADPVIEKLNLQKLEKPYEEFDSDSYEVSDGSVRLYTDEDGRIDGVGCFENIYYQDEDLFGLTLDEIRLRLGKEDQIGETILFDFKDNEYEKVPVEFEKWSLQLWFREGVVESAMVNGLLNDE